METKRLLLAIVLSVSIFLGWQIIFNPSPKEGIVTTGVNATSSEGTPIVSASSENPMAPAISLVENKGAIPEGKKLVVTTPLYKAVFNSHGGVLEEFDLLKYRTSLASDAKFMNMVSKDSSATGPMGLLVNGVASWTEGTWTVDKDTISLAKDGSAVVRFTGDISGTKVTRDITFSGSSYTIGEKTAITTPEKKNINISYTVGSSGLTTLESPSIVQRIRYMLFGGDEPKTQESSMNLTRVSWLKDGSFSEENSSSKLNGDNGQGMLIKDASWVGIMNNYFISAVILPQGNATALVRHNANIYRIAIGSTQILSSPDIPAVTECSYYFGPKETNALAEAPGHLDKSLHYGFFTIIATPLVSLLQFLEKYVGNYGVAIILLTVIVKLVLWPLSIKSYRSMNKMRKIQPLMQEVRERYANDKEKMNVEMMALYKRHKVNPAGGCLPILVQIPVFFALYQVLLNSIELRHAAFISKLPFTDLPWLADLAGPDPYLITPLVMGASMFIQQKLTPTPGDPTQAKVMLFMPIIFTFMFLGFPAGLVLYWLTNNIISIGQQWSQMRFHSDD